MTYVTSKNDLGIFRVFRGEKIDLSQKNRLLIPQGQPPKRATVPGGHGGRNLRKIRPKLF